MGSYQKIKGTQREIDVCDLLERDGWWTCRSAGSLGAADVVALKAGHVPLMVQVKAQRGPLFKGFGPLERERLVAAAEVAGARALYCKWPVGESEPQWVDKEDWPPPSKRGEPDYIVNATTGCWEWAKYITRDGYGYMTRDGCGWLAHRYYYTKKIGPIPEGLQLDHLCRNRSCVNPEHLEPVTQLVNRRRGKLAKLTPVEVREIRLDEGKLRDIAERYGVSFGQIHKIKTRKQWADVPD